MKRNIVWISIGIVVLLALLAIIDSITLINPGNCGVMVSRTQGGISPNPLGVGYHFAFPITQEIVEYPITMQTIVLAKSPNEGGAANNEINLNSIEGQNVSCDVSLSFELDAAKVPHLYSSFRTDIETITHGFVRQTIRQSMQEVVGKTEIVNFLGKEKAQIVNEIQLNVQDRLEQYGFIVKQFTLNEVRAPQSIVAAIEAKNTMMQEALRAENEKSKKEFEAQQQVIIAKGEAEAILARAKAQSQSNQLLTQSITSQLIEYEKIKKWDGRLPQVQGSSGTFLQMPNEINK